MLNLTGIAMALAAQSAVAVVPMTAHDAADITVEETELASDLILSGQKEAALAQLQQQRDLHPKDPAILINLGIAYAHVGDDAKARAAFKSALGSEQSQELDTADGRTMDSRVLARQALSMLNGGEFRTLKAQNAQGQKGSLASR